ncbi:MAG: hypothetical protein U0X91_01415 [Spirosomataceae bacterium]
MKRIKLEDINRSLPYKAPEDYFDKLPSVMQKRIQEHIAEKEHPFTISWSWRRTALAGAAASVVGVLLWVTYPQRQYALGDEPLSQVTNTEIVNYLKDNQITQQEMDEQAQLSDVYGEEEVLLQQLNVDDEDLKKAIQEVDLEGTI